MPTITTSCVPFAAGSTAVAGTGQDTTCAFSGAYNTGDKYTVLLTDAATGIQKQVGAGNVTGTQPTFAYVFQNKVYTLSGATTYFSALASASIWNDPNGTGNGFVSMSNWYSTPEDLIAIASYQGKLAFFSRSTTQIWTVAANPALWAQNQVMTNIGTFAAESVQSVGDFDVFFLSDTGVRSLRVQNISLNAYVDDLGSPIDSLVLAQLATLTPTQLASCTAVVEPTYHRYWLFVPNSAGTGGTMYVYSGFRSSKVSAWSTYQPTYSAAGTQTAFVPQNFIVYKGLVYTRDTTALYGYQVPVASGGALYDNCVATVTSPYMDMKTPVTRKLALGLDMVAFGDFTTNPADPCAWALSTSLDPISGIFSQVVNANFNPNTANQSVNPSNPAIQATSNSGSFPFQDRGTHFAFKATTSGTGSAVFSEIIYRYDAQGEKS